MDKKKNGIPKLRFPGFTGAWEQRKLGEVATRITRKNKNLESTLPLTISAQLGLVDQISYFDKRVASANLTNYILLKKGEFAYNKSYSNGYPFGTVKRLNNYDSGVIPSLYIAFLNNNEIINSDFMETYFETSLWHKEVSARAAEGARNHGLLNISPNDFMEISIKLPTNMKEQIKITQFLHDFDSLIALHQRKLDHLKEQKTGLLQKMFPKKGEVVPEVRFPGFTDAWEQRKLNNFLETSRLKNLDHKFKKEDILSVSGDYGIVNQIEFQGRSFAGASLKNYKVVEPQNVVYTKSPLKANPYGIVKANKGKKGIVSTLYAVYKTKGDVNANFVEYYFANDYRLNTYLKPIVNKGAKNTILISDDNAINGKVIFPLDYDEQKKIGVFLTNLDSLIALHQRKLDHLQLLKKGLLQQMFV